MTSRTRLETEARVEGLLGGYRDAIYRRTDRMFAGLLVFQWAAMIALALWVSPLTWAAVAFGGVVVSLPVFLALARPGRADTRFIVAAAQMLSAGLLIHLTGGRIEAHIHVFGSLAFLAFYRDWRVLVVASAVTAADHLVRGFAWPESVYGTAAGVDWRWLGRAGWVVFLALFLAYACWRGDRDLRRTAEREAELEAARATVEERVRERTAELWQTEERFRRAFEDAATGMALVAPDGRFLRVNRTLCEIVGSSESELLATTSQVLTHPADLAAERERIRRALRGEADRYQMEARYRHRGGKDVWVLLSVSLVRDAAGEPLHFVSQIQDITARKRGDEALRAATATAEAASRAKSEFLATMSHELRDPLNGIVGFSEVLLTAENLTDKQRRYAGNIMASGQRLMAVINDLLEFSKIEAGKLDLDAQPFSVRDAVGDALKALTARAHGKGLELVYDIHCDVPDLLLGDAHRLRQVLTNLVGNAVKFTEHGEVVVCCRRVDEPSDGVRLWFSVSDTGIGIPPEKVKAVFEPFTQADAGAARKYGGTGLGLTICQRLVELMGGRIWAESEPGKGSTFYFEARFARASGTERVQRGELLRVVNCADTQPAAVETPAPWNPLTQTPPPRDGHPAFETLERLASEVAPFTAGPVPLPGPADKTCDVS